MTWAKSSWTLTNSEEKINKNTKDIQKIGKSHIVWKSVKLSHFTKWRAKRATFLILSYWGHLRPFEELEIIWAYWGYLRILRLLRILMLIVIEVIWGCWDNLRILRSFEAMRLLRSFEDVEIIWISWGHLSILRSFEYLETIRGYLGNMRSCGTSVEVIFSLWGHYSPFGQPIFGLKNSNKTFFVSFQKTLYNLRKML